MMSSETPCLVWVKNVGAFGLLPEDFVKFLSKDVKIGGRIRLPNIQ